MHYDGNIIRPPSEADSILLQITVGCSHNSCTFCGAYKDKKFKIKSSEQISKDIEYASKHFTNYRRLFLCDGDALILSQDKLVKIFKEINTKLPFINRISLYASAKSIEKKTLEEIKELKDLKLGVVHMGLESGDRQVLELVKKYGSPELMVTEAQKIKNAGIKLFVTVLLGIGGVNKSEEHAISTGKVLSKMEPDYIGALTLMITENTPLYHSLNSGEFKLPDSLNILKELYLMLEHLELKRGIFFANHASNYLPIQVRLPKDKEKTLEMIKSAIGGNIQLKPEWLRAL